MPTTFKSLLWQLARDAGKNPDASLGTADLSTPLQHMMLHWLNEALDYVWLDHAPYFIKPEITTSASKTVTANVIGSNAINTSPWVAVYTADPRISDTAQPVKAVFKANEDVYLPDVSSGTVFVFWVVPKPQWTLTASVDATSYNTGAVVYHASSGDCYVALQNAVLGSQVSDATKWAPQRAPDVLIQPLRDYARYKWLMSRELEKPAMVAMGKAELYLENRMLDITRNKQRPWALSELTASRSGSSTGTNSGGSGGGVDFQIVGGALIATKDGTSLEIPGYPYP
jgi:hypothetical protein